MSAAHLIARLREQRNTWLVLREAEADMPELAVCLRRPPEADLPDFRPTADKPLHQLLAESVCKAVVGWRGFTEADLLGSAVGSSDAVDFHPDLWAEVVRDRSDWLNRCAAHLMECINAHIAARAEQRKN